MEDRKNIFLIGRRGHEGDEDQLTEMLAFLWQEDREALRRWLGALGLAADATDVEVETQFAIPSGKRPDILIRADGALTLVESKLRAGFGETQIRDYLEFLGEQSGSRALVLLTQRPEVIPVEYREVANQVAHPPAEASRTWRVCSGVSATVIETYRVSFSACIDGSVVVTISPVGPSRRCRRVR